MKVITSPNTRWSYVHVWDPVAVNGGKEKYSISLLIPKNDPCVPKIREGIRAAYEEGAGKLKGSGKTVPPLSAIRTPLRDGDVERPDDPAYAGYYFINASSETRPGIVDGSLQEIIDRSEVYSGCYGRASINFYVYSVNGNRGIAAGLNNLQKLRDGESLGGRSSAAEDFATDDSDDFLS